MRDLRWLAVLLGVALGACQLHGTSGGEKAAEDEAASASEAGSDEGSAGDDVAASAAAPAAAPVAGAKSATRAAEPEARRGSAPTPAPTPVPVVVPEGTELIVVLEATYSSASNKVGDAVLAKLADDVSVDGRVVIPAGTEVRGSVTGAKRSGKSKGRARLALGFDRLVIEGHNRDMAASGVDVTADDSKKRDAAIIGGGAGAGAIVGGIAKGGKGAAIGGLIGGAAGTAAVLTTRGKEVEFPAGTQIRVVLKSPLQVR